jgi:hypothetical protein
VVLLEKPVSIYPRETGQVNLLIEETTGFENYTTEIITELRHMFADEKIDSRPIRYIDVIIWLDSEQRMHRKGLPAVERQNNSHEFWEKGIKKEKQ